jgi:hypothetical protein
MSIPIWTAVNKLAQHAEELAARVERLEQAQQQPAPSTPAGKGELVRSVADTMGHHSAIAREADSRRAILAVVDWLKSQAWRGAADALRREVGR